MATRPNRKISDFKSAMTGGGARPNLFEVEMTLSELGFQLPGFSASDFQFMCKAASIPAMTVASIDVPFRGRIFKVAGDRTIDTWTVTIINDESFNLRGAFESWTEQIAKLDNNLGATDPNSYMASATVYQLGRGEKASSSNNSGSANALLQTYKFDGIFPTEVSTIDLSYDSSDTIEEFTVTFAVQSIERLGKSAVSAASPNVSG